jgi:hypothetical protein
METGQNEKRKEGEKANEAGREKAASWQPE